MRILGNFVLWIFNQVIKDIANYGVYGVLVATSSYFLWDSYWQVHDEMVGVVNSHQSLLDTETNRLDTKTHTYMYVHVRGQDILANLC